ELLCFLFQPTPLMLHFSRTLSFGQRFKPISISMGTQRALSCFLLAALLSSSDAGLVKKILRHRRQTPQPAEEHNVTLPSGERPVVFSHVYNINVPASSLCSVDLDAPESARLRTRDAGVPPDEHAAEHTVDGENQIVFTHRINVPRRACGCSEDLPGLKELMSRLEMLEGEVSALRDQCHGGGGGACCGAQVTGEVATKPYCHGHGNYSAETCGCVCEPGWKGPNCTRPGPGTAGKRGRCVHGELPCATDPGRAPTAPSLPCPKDCHGRGLCQNGTCRCDAGYAGEDCGGRTCANNCHGNGFCADGACVCAAGFSGDDCSRLTCLNGCSDRGACFNGVCICQPGYQGADCSQLACLNDCNGRGQCVNGRCACDVGFQGDDCAELSCPSDCLRRGRCLNGQCVCEEGFVGEDCGGRTCPSNCHGRGECVEGRCECRVGFAGSDCGELSCPGDCRSRGRCVDGQCVCDEGFSGEDCGRRACPNDCLARGRCVDGACVCRDGYSGDDCSALACPANCNGRGRCVDGRCACDSGHEGESCAQLSCLNGCRDKGRCESGRCVCDEGFIGDDCSGGERLVTCSMCSLEISRGVKSFLLKTHLERNQVSRGRIRFAVLAALHTAARSLHSLCSGLKARGHVQDNSPFAPPPPSPVSPPKDLTVGEVTPDTVELSWSNDMLVTEYLVTYVPTSPGGLHAEFTVSGDKAAATVKELEPGIEYQINVYAVLSNATSVPVGARVATELPKPEGVIFKPRESSVRVMWDQLDIPFDGWEIYFRNPQKEENGEVVSTLPPSQNWFVQSGLGPGQEYEVSINIIKNDTRGPRTSKRVTTKIDGPRQLEVKDVTDSSALVVWFQPASPTDGLSMVYGPSADPSDKTRVDISPSDKQHSLGALRPDTEYKVSLVSRSGGLASAPAVATFTTALDAPLDLQSLSQTDDSVTLEWTNSQADVGGYLVKYSPISGASHGEELFPRGPGQTTRATITGLHPGTEYGIGVTATKNERQSLPATTNAATDIDPPTDLEGTESTETSLALSWQRPRARVGAYRLEYSSEDGRVGEAEIPGAATSYVLSDLTPGMSYTLTLSAERGLSRSAPVTASASTGTEPEDELTVSGVTPDGFDLTWTLKAHGVYDSLTVAYKDARPLRDAREAQLPGDAAGSRIRGLNASTEYQIKLYGITGSQRSALLEAVAVTVSQPVVGELYISNITSESFSISWNGTEGEFDGFTLELIDSDWLTEQKEYNVSRGVESLEVTGLRPGTDYVAYVSGTYKGSRTSPVSIVASTAEEPDLSGLLVSNVTSDRFSLSWRAGAKAFDNFIVEVRESALPSQAMGRALPGGARSTVMAGLKARTSYDIKLYASAGGRSTRPLFDVATTEDVPQLGPVAASPVSPHNLSLSWSAVSGHFDGFVVRVSDAEQRSDPLELRLPGEARNVTLTDLADATGYDIELYGISHGRHTPSVLAHAVTDIKSKLQNMRLHPFSTVLRNLRMHAQLALYCVLGLLNSVDNQIFGLLITHNLCTRCPPDGFLSPPPTQNTIKPSPAPLPKVENLTISNVTPFGFRVSWAVQRRQEEQEEESAPSSGGFRHFHVAVTDSGWLLEPQEFTVPGNQSHLDVWGLITGIGYEVRLTGVSESGLLSRPLTTVAATEAEPEVEHLFVSDVTADGFRLSWAADGDLFDRYVIRIRDAKRAARPREYAAGGAERTKVLTGLASGTEYEIELYGVSLDQRSQPVSGVAQTALSTPRGLRFSHVTGSSAVVHWSTPRSPVDNYRITYVPSEGGSPLSVTVDGDVFEALLPDMIPGKTYQVTVSAVKGLEESDPTTDNVITALDRPRGLSVANVTDTSALLLWQPSVATVDGYVITYSADSVSHVVEHVSGDTAAFQMGSLVPGTRYTVGVHATKESRRSDSAGTEFTTDVDPPRDVTAVNIGADSATLTWKPPQAAVSGYTLSFYPAGGAVREVVLSPTASSYVMAELTRSTEYSVRLQAIAGAQRSRHADAAFTTVGQLHRRPKDCAQVLLNGETSSGLHTVYVGGEQGPPVQVYCDMTTDGGGWMVFLRRQNGKLDFFRNWKNYTVGFGNMNDEFWLGLSNLHKITNSGHYELRVDLRDSGESAYAQYDRFTVAEPKTRYKVSVGSYSGTAGDSMSYHQGRPFSTYDNDNDIAVTNCALSYKGAFWYKNCHRVNLMGKYGDDSHSKGINWFHWKAHEHSIPFAEMKIRPADFGKFESRKKRS
uniref:Zmp:0000000846 n=1 Tax=Gasterosteus aculeatus TaxID=69293 RepID=G3PTD5_GASAC